MFKIDDIFQSVQGEGIHAGCYATFVRFYGCNLSCDWCDTPQDDDYREMCVQDVLNAVLGQNNGRLVVLTGGEPLLQNGDELNRLVGRLQSAGMEVIVETNGTQYRIKYHMNESPDWWIVSPKPPSAKNGALESKVEVEKWPMRENVVFKFPIKNSADFMWMEGLIRKINTGLEIGYYCHTPPIVIQPVDNDREVFKRIVRWTKEHMPEELGRIRFIPQVHKLMGIK